MENNINKFIGSGITFPIELSENGRPIIVKDINLIKKSIIHILSWPYRTRFFNAGFGSRIEELIEEPDDNVSISLLRHFILESIVQWEKRIELYPEGIKIISSDHEKINVSITFKIRNTKIEETFIYPFYKEIKY
jgi:phage baseplate assembly protein W